MTQRLKRWESPRRQGRNEKGKGGSARQRQLRKQQQMLRKKLKDSPNAENHDKKEGRDISTLPSFFRGLGGSIPKYYEREQANLKAV